MNRTKLALGIAATVVFAAAAASAQERPNATRADAGQESYAAYRRVVLGDTSVVTPATSMKSVVAKVIPGGYARYLVHNGFTEEDALRQARQERVDALVAVCDEPLLNSYERYQRTVLGVSLEGIMHRRAVARPAS